jgi:hypothetical protein
VAVQVRAAGPPPCHGSSQLRLQALPAILQSSHHAQYHAWIVQLTACTHHCPAAVRCLLLPWAHMCGVLPDCWPQVHLHMSVVCPNACCRTWSTADGTLSRTNLCSLGNALLCWPPEAGRLQPVLHWFPSHLIGCATCGLMSKENPKNGHPASRCTPWPCMWRQRRQPRSWASATEEASLK